MANIHEVNTSMAGYVATKIYEAREEGPRNNPYVAWVANELEHWKQRCEELEIELEVMRNAFPEHDNDVLPKRRCIF